MKFSHTLSLNSNPEWAGHYIDYADLKKVINDLASQQVQDSFLEISDTSIEDEQEQIAMTPSSSEFKQLHCRKIFLDKLKKMIMNVRNFYYEKRSEFDKEFIRLKSVMDDADSSPSLNGAGAKDENNNTDDSSFAAIEISPLLEKHPKTGKMKSLSDMTPYQLETLRREIADLFTQYHNLSIFAMLNCTAVRKILKKYDKVMNDNIKESHAVLDELKAMLPFWDGGTPELEQSINLLKEYFTWFCCNGDADEASRRMKLMEREVVTFQRHSVWLDVIEDQRKHEQAQVTVADAETKLKPSTLTKREGVTAMRAKSFLQQVQSSLTFIISLTLFVGLLLFPGVFDDDPVKRNALAMFVFVSLLWATEALPLFVTSMIVPLLSVMLRLIVIDEVRLDAKSASKHVFAAMFSHVIMLLIGGFSIAAALSKHNVAKIMASSISRHCGSGIRTVLLVNMFIATLSSMWISNVAAPILCYSLITPILKATAVQKCRAPFGTKQLKSADNDQRLCRALVMGIALASNVGGMASPISSPQNLFAIEYTPIGWVPWFVVSIPICITLNLIIWLWLVYCFQLPCANSSAVSWALQRDRSGSESLSITQYFVIIVSVGVVIMWCGSVEMAGVTGEMGVLGIVPFVLFFGTGVLSKEDLNNFLWTVVILAMGGLVLGEAIKASGLLNVIANEIALFIEYNSLSLWETLCIFTSLILFCTTFVSHTVGAIVVLPIAYAVGSHMEPVHHSKELVFGGALVCSAAMGLPVSGFPNMTAVGVEDNLGNRFLSTKDFLKIALPASIFSWIIIVTLGYGLILQAVRIDDGL